MGARSSWKDLQNAYLAFLGGRPSSEGSHWLAIWQRFIDHPYYRRQARQIARTFVRCADSTGPTELDLRTALMMLLARRIQSRRDSKTTYRITRDFPRWLQSILFEDCRLACSIRFGDKLSCRDGPIDPGVLDAIPLRVHELISELADPLRSVLLLYLSDFTPFRIAESLDLDQTQVDRLIHSGVAILVSRMRRHR